MGTAMAQRLLAAGHQLTVWNRSPAAAESLASAGARAAATPADAVRGCEIVLSMLFDDAAHQEVLLGAHGALSHMD